MYYLQNSKRSETQERIGLSGPRLYEKDRNRRERLALGFTSPLVFVASGTPLVSHFIAWKSFIFESKRFGAFIKSILVDIIFSKYFIILEIL